MAQEIYNEGRIVGLSAWEIFAKNAEAAGISPTDIPNENQWLTAMIGAGASMVLKISAGTSGIQDYPLPLGSNLTSAGVIIANPFMGTCSFDTSGWAKKVTSYSGLIENIPGSKNQQDTFSGDGVTSTFTLTNTPSTVDSVTIGGVSTADYTLEINKITLIHEENDSFEGDGTTKTFNLSAYAIELTSVTVDGTVIPEEDYGLDADSRTVTFITAPSNQSDIVITYSAAPISGTDNIIVNYTYVASPDRNTTVPEDSNYSTYTYKNCVSEFIKITDGIVYTRNANWVPSHDGEPEKDIDPNFNESSTVVRLYISSALRYDVLVIFTGFQNKRILQGLSGFAAEDAGISSGGSTDMDSNDWQNGGMLGPEIIPWASKIIFTIPSSAYTLSNSLNRRIPSDATYSDGTYQTYTFRNVDSEIKPNSLIDFNSIILKEYYDSNHNNKMSSCLNEATSNVVLGINDACNTLTAWYPGMTASKIKASGTTADDFFPPALYATQVDPDSNSQTLVPIDVAAPGTVKGFTDRNKAKAYKALLPDNFAIFNDTTAGTFNFVVNGTDVWSGTAKIDYISDTPKATITAGNKQVGVIALTRSDNTTYNTSGSAGALNPADPSNPQEDKPKPNRYLTWDNLMNCLYNGYKFDILGNRLNNVGLELANTNSMGNTYKITSVKLTDNSNHIATLSTAAGNRDGATVIAASHGIKSGTNYVEFSNGLRLYISGSKPTGSIPDGSIGIGWVNS